jgi:hypothetical protein
VRVGFWWGNMRERDHLENLRVQAMMMLKRILNKSVSGVDWINVAQGTDK